MSNLQLGRMTGLAVGIVVGLILEVVIMRAVNFNHKMKTEYDEMQRSIRDRGYKYGFYTILIVEALFCVVSSGMDIPAVPIVVHFIPIFLGIVVQASYCIWNNAYVGLNTNMKRYIIVAVAASLTGKPLVQQDKPLVVVSIGDSYSSGEGLEEFEKEVAPDGDTAEAERIIAHRSLQSWPGQLIFTDASGATVQLKDCYCPQALDDTPGQNAPRNPNTAAPTSAPSNNIPKTGDAGVGVVIALAVAAGAAFVFTRKKNEA